MDLLKDILIVGQGVAGTILGWQAYENGLSFDIYDQGALKSASAISSGIINPVTGPKFVKSWKIDEFLPFALSTYQMIEQKLGTSLVNNYPIWCHLDNINKENLWQSRIIDPGYERHLSNPKDLEVYDKVKSIFKSSNKFGVVTTGKYIDTSKLIKGSRSYWKDSGVLFEELLNLSLIEQREAYWRYGKKSYKHVVLALGHKAVFDKWFKTDIYRPVKGDLLICRIPGLPNDKILKYGKFILPLGKDLFWVGSNYDRSFEHELPDKHEREMLISFLKETVDRPFEIAHHRAGIRCTTEFRRPLVGEHPDHKSMYLFNGLGTKGISIAPYFGDKIIQSIKAQGHYQNWGFKKCFT